MSRYLERAGVARALKSAIAEARPPAVGPDRDGRAAPDDEASRPAMPDPAAWRTG